MLVDAEQRAPIDAKRLTCDVAGLVRAEKRARRTKIGGVSQSPHGCRRYRLGYLFFGIDPTGPRDVAQPVSQDRIRREAVHSDSVLSELAREGLGQDGHSGPHRVRELAVRVRYADRYRCV